MKNNKIARIGLSVALVASLGCFGIVASGCSQPQEEAPAAEQKAEQGYKVRVNAEGWDEATSTPVVLVAQQVDGKLYQVGETTYETYEEASAHEGDIVEIDKTVGAPICRSVDANVDDELSLDSGSYTLEVIPPVNADGSLYAVPELVRFDVPSDDGSALELTLVPAEEVTAEQASQIIEALTIVGSVDAEAVSPEVIERAKSNAAVAPNVSPEVMESAQTSANEAVAAGGGSSIIGNASDAASPARPSTNQSNASAPSNNGGSSAGGNATNQPSAPSQPVQQPSQPSAPSHAHDYTIPITEQVWVDEGSYILCSCDLQFPNIAAHGEHADEMYFNYGERNHSYSAIENGHYETKTTGYKCSCGARR